MLFINLLGIKMDKYFNPHEEKKFTELHSYCWECCPGGVRWCLKNNFDPNAEDERGWTPLIWLVRMYGCSRERKKMFRYLMAAGARLDHVDKIGQNIIELAENVCSQALYRHIRKEYKRKFGKIVKA